MIQDYGFRLYNLAIARFLSVDPLRFDYPELTPYQFALNTPITATDLDGLEANLAIWFAKKTAEGDFGKGTQTVVKKTVEIVDLAVIRPAKAMVNTGSTAAAGFDYAVGTKLPEAFGFDVEDTGLGEVWTTEGITEFGSAKHNEVLKESAEAARDEIIYGGAAAVGGHLAAPVLGPLLNRVFNSSGKVPKTAKGSGGIEEVFE